MTMKGLSLALKVVVILVVILVVAFVILTMFTGGTTKAIEQMNTWLGHVDDINVPTAPIGGFTGGRTCAELVGVLCPGDCAEGSISVAASDVDSTTTCCTAQHPGVPAACA